MIKISDALEQIFRENHFLELGLSHRLLNLSQVAEFLMPLVEARTQKEVTKTALLMNLSRFQRKRDQQEMVDRNRYLKNISVRSNLMTMSFYKVEGLDEKIHQLHKQVHEQGGYFIFTESMNEVTIIFDADFKDLAGETLQAQPIFFRENLASVSAHFTTEQLSHPGMIYLLVQKITLQNINIVEIVSTCSNLLFFIDRKNVKLAFETLESCFDSQPDMASM